jgi:hypothetical protein
MPDDDGCIWVLLYLVDWFPDCPVTPDVHKAFATWQEAEQHRKTMGMPERYWVRKVRLP